MFAQGDAVASAWLRYEERLKSIIADFAQWLGPEYLAKVRELLGKIDLTTRAAGVFATSQSLILLPCVPELRALATHTLMRCT